MNGWPVLIFAFLVFQEGKGEDFGFVRIGICHEQIYHH